MNRSPRIARRSFFAVATAAVTTRVFAQDAAVRSTGLRLEDSHSVYTTSTPSPYVRFFARNRTGRAHVVQVVSLWQRMEGGAVVPLTIGRLEVEQPTLAVRDGRITVPSGAEPLVVVWFDDRRGGPDAGPFSTAFRVVVEVDGQRRELDLDVPRAYRDPVPPWHRGR